MHAFVDVLLERSRGAKGIDAPAVDALCRLDAMMTEIASALQVEYYGPEVGVGAGRHVYRLVVRAHEWETGSAAWSLKVCTALPHAKWRADWSVQAASRQRKMHILAALPAFFAGYAAAVIAAGKAESAAGRRVTALAQRFGAS